jgi:tubulin polyglutamylase TTLL6/13
MNPMLIDGLKFDMRIYALIFSVDPLKIYLFKEGLSRFSTEKFKAPAKKNLKNMFMHLTNYAINCKNKGKFVFNETLKDPDVGHKRTFTYILKYIEENYDNGKEKADEVLL